MIGDFKNYCRYLTVTFAKSFKLYVINGEKMKKKSIILCMIILTLIVLSGCTNREDLIGRWEEKSGETNPIGVLINQGYEFNEDGTLKIYQGTGETLNISEYTWVGDGRNSYIGNGNGGEFKMKYLIEDDVMYLDYEQNIKNDFKLKENGKYFEKVNDFSFSDLIRRNTLHTNMTAEEIATAMKDEGLNIDEIFVYTEENDASHLMGRPKQYISKAEFEDINIKQGEYSFSSHYNGGVIRVFETIADAESDFKERSGAIYIYKTGNVVLILDKQILPDNALEYKEIFYKVVE